MSGDLKTYLKDEFKWKNRIIFVFAESFEDQNYKKQLDHIKKHRDGYKDRDLVIFKIVGDSIIDAELQNLESIQPSELRAAFGIKPQQFRSLLIGKDGGVKILSRKPISACDLFNLIDQMPMRREEIKAKGDAISCKP